MNYFRKTSILLVNLAGLLIIVSTALQRSSDAVFFGLGRRRVLVIMVCVVVLVIFNGLMGWTRRTKKLSARYPIGTDIAVVLLPRVVLAWGYLYISEHPIASQTDKASFGVASLVLLFALVTAIPTMNRPSVIKRIAIIIFSLFLVLIPAEIAMRSMNLFDYSDFQPNQSNLNLTYHPTEEIFPGISGDSHITTDQYSIRAIPFFDELAESTYRILAVGGSTTEALYLDDTEAWPYLIQQYAQEEGVDLWVGNVGRAGHHSVMHYWLIEKFVPNFDLDMLVLLVGANDFTGVIRDDAAGLNTSNRSVAASIEQLANDPHQFEIDVQRFFYDGPERLLRLENKLAVIEYPLYRLDKRFFPDKVDPVFVDDPDGESYIVRRQRWQDAPEVRDALPPNFDHALEVYRDNLERIVMAAKAQGLEIVLVTQPSVWRADLPEDFKQYLWLAFYGTRRDVLAQYSMDVLADGMTQYNDVLLAVCAEQDITCVDLAAEINGNTSLYYDDLHFNEEGSRRVAEIVWDGLRDMIHLPGM